MPDSGTDVTNGIHSPYELERKGFIQLRGRILGNARLGKRAGVVGIAILVLVLSAILYGVTLNRNHSIALRQQYAKPLPPAETAPWWKTQSDAARAVRQPVAVQTNSQSPALPSGVPDLDKLASTASSTPAATSSRSSTGVSEAEILNPQARIPTIPLLEEQPVAPGTQPGEPAGQHLVATQNEKQALLQAAMQSALLLTGAPSDVTAPQPTLPAANLNVRTPRERAVGNVGAPASISDGPPSPFQLKAGSIIPAALLTAIDSDLPGLTSAQVRQNVYDTATGRYLLIPQGAKVIGTYNSRVPYGQERVLVTWTRLIYPDGSSFDLQDMAGADPAGRSGFDAQVNNHTGKLLQGALLLSIIGAGAQLSQPQQSAINGSAPSIGQVVAGSVGSQIASAGEQITQRQLNVAPNLRVPAGYQFNVLVDRDITFRRLYPAN